MTSVATEVRSTVTTLRSGIGSLCVGLVIGMLSNVSIDSMSFSKYDTPTKYWFLLLGSIQKLCLLNWMLELNAATTFRITSSWVKPELGRLGPVHLDDEHGIIQPLNDPRIDHAVDVLDLVPDRGGDPVCRLLVLAGDPDADRCRLALVHRRADHAAGVEGELQVAEGGAFRELASELLDILLGRLLPLGR